MRLTELEPQFITVAEEPLAWRHVATFAEAHGIVFLCPCGEGHVVQVWFRDRHVKLPDDAKAWVASGSSFEDLSLQPSILLPCWHGFVTRGEVS